MLGSEALAEYLFLKNIRTVYGVPGIPITPVAEALATRGIRYIAFRNEQAAAYAASVHSYLHGGESLGTLLVTGGPGFIHALPGIVGARENMWSLLVIVGTCRQETDEFEGTFQECHHESFVKDWACFESLLNPGDEAASKLNTLMEHTLTRINHPFGISILEISEKWLNGTVNIELKKSIAMPRNEHFELPDLTEALAKAKQPIVVFGKGACIGRLDELAVQLVDRLNSPFILMPMAKGLISEDHLLCMAAARSQALQRADLMILVGVRSNWMLPISKMIKARDDLAVIRIDLLEKDPLIEAEHSSRVLNLVGHARDIVETLISTCTRVYNHHGWISDLQLDKARNKDRMDRLTKDVSLPLSYHVVYEKIAKVITLDTTVVCEGANTMDIARISIPTYRPRGRLDAGTFGAMGVGMPYAIATAIARPNDPILYIAGDSAFGFSLAEIETAVRYKLFNLTIVVMNNSGVYNGITEEEYRSALDHPSQIPLLPPTALTPGVRYDQLANLLPGKIQGFFITDLSDLEHALRSKSSDKISILNVIIRNL